MNYIVLTRDNDIWLTGPFVSPLAAADYGATAESELWNRDPRWQTIDLASTFGLRIERPANIAVQPGAYTRACGGVFTDQQAQAAVDRWSKPAQ